MAKEFPAFAEDSMMRRVMSERVVAYGYGMRASFVGALHPMAFIGTNLHTTAHDGGIYDRMYRTGLSFEAVQLGDADDIARERARVAELHTTVRGQIDRDLRPLRSDASPHRAGETYAAYDPHQSFFTMAFLCESATTLYETFVGELTPTERQTHYEDWITFGEIYGMKRSWAPPTWSEFLDTYHGYLRSDRAYLIRSARAAGLSLVNFTLPLPLRGLNELNYLVVVGTVDDHIREEYGVRWTRRHQLEFEVLRRTTRTGRRVTPGFVARGRTMAHVGWLARAATRALGSRIPDAA